MKRNKKQKHSQTKPENGSVSIPMKEEKSNTQSLDQVNIPSNNSLVLMTIQTMMYGQFLRILLEEEIKPENWNNILDDYVDEIKTPKSETIFQVLKNVYFTDWKINFLFGNEKPKHYGALHLLKMQYDAEIAEMVMLMGYNLIKEMDDRDRYLKQIYLIENQAKTLIVILNQYDKEYKLLSNDDSGKHRTRSDYEKEISIISKFIHFRIDKEVTPVIEWCAHVNHYIEDNARRATL